MAVNYPVSLDNNSSLLEAKDLVMTTLASPVDSVVTTLPLLSASAFPTLGGIVKLDNELIKYTGVSGNSLTGAERGYSGTAASAHSTGTEVRLVVAADYHNSLKDAVIALERKVGIGDNRVALGAGEFAAATGAPTLSTPGGIAAWQLSATVDQTVSGEAVRHPSIGGSLKYRAFWNTPDTTGNVVLEARLTYLRDGAAIPTSAVLTQTVAVPGVANQVKVIEFTFAANLGQTGDMYVALFGRLGADAADTAASALNFYGLELLWTP